MSSENVIDEFVVKVKVDTSEYDNQVEELAGSNEKLAEGLEDTEKQLDKTSKSSKDNAKSVKNTNDEYQKLATNLGTTISLLAKMGGSFIAGTGIAKFAADAARANDGLNFTAKNIGSTFPELKKWGYVANELGGNADSMVTSMSKIAEGIRLFDISGDDSMLRFLNEMNVAFKDSSGNALELNDVLLDLSDKMSKKNRAEAYVFAKSHGFDDATFNVLMQGRDKVSASLKSQDDKYISDDKTLENTRKFVSNMGELGNQVNSLANMFADSLIPALTEFQEVIKGFFGYLQKNPEEAKALATGATVATAVGGSWAITKLFKRFFRGGAAAGVKSAAKPKIHPILYAVPFLLSGTAYDEKALKDQAASRIAFDKKRKAFDEKHGDGSSKNAAKKYNSVFAAAPHPDGDYMDRWEKDVERNKKIEAAFGDDYVKEVYKNKAPSFRKKDWRSQNPDDTIKDIHNSLRKEDIEKLFDKDTITSAYRENRAIFSSPSWKGNDPQKTIEYIETYLSKKLEGLESSGANRKEIDETKSLLKEANDLAKKSYDNPILKSIDSTLKVAFPQNEDNSDLVNGILGLNKSYTGGNKEKKALDFFKSMGWTDEQAVGIVANLKAESGLNEKAVNPNEVDSRGNKFSSLGIAQWNRERLDKFREIMGKDVGQASFREQLAFVQWELENTHKKAAKNLKKSNNVNDATRAITEHYEIPADMENTVRKRQKTANKMGNGALVSNDYSAYLMQRIQTMGQQAPASQSTSTVDVIIGDIAVYTTSPTLSGVGQDVADGVNARMMLGQLTTGVV